ncbi:MAG TPA: hypothetical protein V6C72_19920, partial [Chroococcales cyanobacterium]
MAAPADSFGKHKEEQPGLRISDKAAPNELTVIAQRAELDYSVAHSMPGRFRIKLEALKREPAKIDSCLMQLLKGTGVTGVKTNYWCGSATIEYDQSILDEDQVRGLLDNLDWPASELASPLPAKPSLAVRIIQKVLSILDHTLPAVVQVVLGGGAFASAILGLPSIVSQALLVASMAPIVSRALHTVVDERKLGVDALDGMAAGMMLANGRIVEAAFMTSLISLGEFIR